MPTFPQVSTKRLLLREPCMDDVALFTDIFSDPQLRRYSNVPRHLTPHSVRIWTQWLCRAYFTRSACAWTIQLRDTGEAIGSVRFNRIDRPMKVAEVGFELLPAFRGLGLMLEALHAIIGLGELRFGLERIEASCANENVASLRVLQKCGFRRVLGKQVFMGPPEDRKACELYSLSLAPGGLQTKAGVPLPPDVHTRSPALRLQMAGLSAGGPRA